MLELMKYVLPSYCVTFVIWYLWNPAWFNLFCINVFLSMIAWTIGYFAFEWFSQDTIDPNNKLVFVTGCDSGFGYSLATKLDKLGFHVFAAVMFPDGDGAQKLKEECSKRLTVIKVDVTKKDDVDHAVQQVKNTKIPLWAIVNNAGVYYQAPFDWGNDLDIYKKTLEVNTFGVVRVTRSFMPLLRESNGRIINVASVAGRINSPWMNHYCMSKNCVRVFSDCLRRELRILGIDVKVITIEPSFFKTPLINQNLLANARERTFNDSPEEVKQYYGQNFLKYMSYLDKLTDKASKDNPWIVGDTMVMAIMKKYPKLFYRCGTYLELFTLWGSSHIPEILLDTFIYLLLGSKFKQFKAGKYQKME